MNRNLDGIYLRIKRDGKYQAVCLSDMTADELEDVVGIINDSVDNALTLLDSIYSSGRMMYYSDYCAAEGRSQGLLTAYRIAKQAAEEGKDPVATLEAELKYRRITKINIPVTKKELETAGERYRINAVQSCKALAMVTLWSAFGFGGRKRLPKFDDEFTRNTDAFFEGYLTWQDVLDTLETECGYKMELSERIGRIYPRCIT